MEKLFESMDIEQEQKIALQESFEKAVLKKTTELLDEHVEKEVAERVEAITEEYNEKVESLTESLDGYLDTVVEDFIAENANSYEAQIADEKAQTLLEMFDNMVKVVGMDMLTIQEAKDTREEEALEESASYKLEEAEDKMSEMAEKLVEARREADKFLKLGIVQELSEGLTVLEKAKFEKLSETVAFTRDPSYIEKLELIKESITDQRSEDFTDAPASLPDAAFRHPEQVDTKSAMDFNRYV